mmetsp:Transcript_5725/g.9097  ORF Transcript_5725/g.9097 Transcript_5725/m.9097 type:complete len:85 (-) Transcript_5725:322-576(-)
MQMHLEGKLHVGYLKIREKLNELQSKKQDDRRRTGLSTYERSKRDRNKREQEEKLEEEAKEHFYYSSNRWGKAKNMPKLGQVTD